MKIVFKAEDGKMFNSAEECVQYESTLVYRAKEWEAWGWTSEPTKKTSHAVVVKLNTTDAAEQFLSAAKLEDDDSIKGIDEHSRGWYYYDECAEQYFRIDEAIINIFKNISTS